MKASTTRAPREGVNIASNLFGPQLRVAIRCNTEEHAACARAGCAPDASVVVCICEVKRREASCVA